MRHFRPTGLVALLLFCIPLSGCAKPESRCEVSGTITFNDKPLENGNIVFITPDASHQASAVIGGGQYRIAKEQGLPPGKYKVSISSPDGKTPDADSNAAPGPSGNFSSKDRIPASFNTNSKHEVDIKLGEPNVFNFKIP
jgi:hypothetical protein